MVMLYSLSTNTEAELYHKFPSLDIHEVEGLGWQWTFKDETSNDYSEHFGACLLDFFVCCIDEQIPFVLIREI